jgi:hypothetical protein
MPDLVSFVIPTLNRRGSVNRAVRSCLALEHDDMAVQVVVLDSMSDDGSWDDLQEEFGDDARVRLHQNARGLGPTRSWLDGAQQISAEARYVTFLWSDDWVFPWFFEDLAPALRAGAAASFGQGLVRDIGDDRDPERDTHPESGIVSAADGTPAFLGRWYTLVGATPSSPAAALFRRDVFDSWMARTESASRRTPTEEQILWRRAIGPDLQLFLAALSIDHWGSTIGHTSGDVVQFSSHDGSITVSSDPWLMQAGYWFARTGWLLDVDVRSFPDAAAIAERLVELARAGLELASTIPAELPSGIDAARARRDARRRALAMLRLHARVAGALPTARRAAGILRRRIRTALDG